MIVFDTSTIIGAAINPQTAPSAALKIACERDVPALSQALYDEVLDVLFRPRLRRFIDPALRSSVLARLDSFAVWFEPTVIVQDCRDRKDNKVLELALVAGASTIVSSDDDLLVLHPWRGVRILRPAAYLAAETA